MFWDGLILCFRVSAVGLGMIMGTVERRKKTLIKLSCLHHIDVLITLYNTGALISINSYLTNAQIIMS